MRAGAELSPARRNINLQMSDEIHPQEAESQPVSKEPPKPLHFLHRPVKPAMIIAIIIGVIFVRGWVFEGAIIEGDSMDPTLRTGERLLVLKRHFNKDNLPARGSIVIFPDPQEDSMVVKRVIGLPGERVGAAGAHIYINERLLDEPYAYYSRRGRIRPRLVKIPEGKVWVLGDNRNNSVDSRFYGAVDLESIRGYAFLRMWPLPPRGILGQERD